jgi:hypothetical protein
METAYRGLKVAISSKGYYVGRLFEEDEGLTQFVRLTDDFIKKQEAVEWMVSILEEVPETGLP